MLNAGQTGTPNCDAANPPVTGHWAINTANTTDTRGFTKTAEAIGGAMRADGYVVDRLFTTDNENVDPQFYYDGTPIPSNLRRPALAWDADTTDFLSSYNAGRFLVLHRDHGSSWPRWRAWTGTTPTTRTKSTTSTTCSATRRCRCGRPHRGASARS